MEIKGIKARWKSFASHLVAGRNATDAYILAGYRNTTRASAQAAASRLLRQPDFAAYLASLRREGEMRSRRQAVMSLRRKLRILARFINAATEGTPLRRRDRVGYREMFGCRVAARPSVLSLIHQYSLLAGHLDVARF